MVLPRNRGPSTCGICLEYQPSAGPTPSPERASDTPPCPRSGQPAKAVTHGRLARTMRFVRRLRDPVFAGRWDSGSELGNPTALASRRCASQQRPRARPDHRRRRLLRGGDGWPLGSSSSKRGSLDCCCLQMMRRVRLARQSLIHELATSVVGFAPRIHTPGTVRTGIGRPDPACSEKAALPGLRMTHGGYPRIG